MVWFRFWWRLTLPYILKHQSWLLNAEHFDFMTVPFPSHWVSVLSFFSSHAYYLLRNKFICFHQDCLDYLMSRENIMPRLNQRILATSESKVGHFILFIKKEWVKSVYLFFFLSVHVCPSGRPSMSVYVRLKMKSYRTDLGFPPMSITMYMILPDCSWFVQGAEHGWRSAAGSQGCLLQGSRQEIHVSHPG